MTIRLQDLLFGFRELILNSNPIIAHASLSALGEIEGGVETLLNALLDSVSALVMPTFTYKTMLTPDVGPPDNALKYGCARDANRMAEAFLLDMPADKMMGVLPEALRRHPRARRSAHPILSFAGVNADAALDAQTMLDPFAPIGVLAEQGGWVLLLGVEHTVNTSIHYAEKLAGRKQFIRWALTPERIVECPGWPGCSRGFQAIAPDVDGMARRARIGKADVQAIPLAGLFEAVSARIKKDPLALLCQQGDCERCNAIRSARR